MMRFWVVASLALTSSLCSSAEDFECGRQKGGALCPGVLCCSKLGYCGTTHEHCNVSLGCQSNCLLEVPSPPPPPTAPPPPPSPSPPPPWTPDIRHTISRELFELMLKRRDDPACPARNFYKYDDFTKAADSFPAFGTTGDNDTIWKMEVAAFLGQTSHETTDWEEGAAEWRYTWGYCILEAKIQSTNCDPNNKEYPCAEGKKYYGRGPFQITGNINYGKAGKALGLDLLNHPEKVATDPVVAFQTALWFWMTRHDPKPSSHDVITGKWLPTAADRQARRFPGYGVITNIINGGVECGNGRNDKAEYRTGFYMRYCDIFRLTSYGENLDCNTQTPWD